MPYLTWLGVDALWLSPFYRSPMADFGYDVSDHCDVDPRFGTLADWDALVCDARGHGIRLVLDLVANHTSWEHPWFQASRDGELRDWYLWQEGSPHRPPNNWVSVFGGSAWSWDDVAHAWYYHAYLPEQPDLNWRSEGVRRAVGDVMRFWLRRGADGFRIDALRQFIKDPGLADNLPDPRWRDGDDPYDALVPEQTTDRPEVLDVVRAMRAVCDEVAREDGRERVLIGELYLPVRSLMRYYGAGLDLPSNLNLLATPWTATDIAALIDEYERALPAGAWPNWTLGNHDRSRLATRVGRRQAPVAAVLLLTLRGTPTLYYGDELAMTDVEIPAERVQDPWERNVPGQGLGRDPARTPMQWDATAHAGFCPADASPWLPLAPDAGRVNVATSRGEPASLLSLYATLLRLRRQLPALQRGDQRLLQAKSDVLVYERTWGDERVIVALNLAAIDREVPLEGVAGEVRLGTGPTAAGDQIRGSLRLRGDEAVVIACRPA